MLYTVRFSTRTFRCAERLFAIAISGVLIIWLPIWLAHHTTEYVRACVCVDYSESCKRCVSWWLGFLVRTLTANTYNID